MYNHVCIKDSYNKNIYVSFSENLSTYILVRSTCCKARNVAQGEDWGGEFRKQRLPSLLPVPHFRYP